MSIFRKKSIEYLLQQAGEAGSLKRTLTATSLIGLGIGAIIGAGLFVRTAAASAEAAGPAVTLSFIIAAVGCLFAGLCYAEFAAMILDLTLPDMAGEAVLAAARGLRPGLPVILTSGMAAPVRSSDSAPGPTEFLMKPYLPARLAEAVQRLLEPQSPSSSTAS